MSANVQIEIQCLDYLLQPPQADLLPVVLLVALDLLRLHTQLFRQIGLTPATGDPGLYEQLAKPIQISGPKGEGRSLLEALVLVDLSLDVGELHVQSAQHTAHLLGLPVVRPLLQLRPQVASLLLGVAALQFVTDHRTSPLNSIATTPLGLPSLSL